jgi:hypothetical protein
MKKYILSTILAFFVCTTVNAGQHGGNKRTSNAAGFIAIKDRVILHKTNIERYKAYEVMQLLKQTNIEFGKFVNIVKSTKNIDTRISEVSKGLNKIATTYEKIASYKKEVFTVRKSELRGIAETQMETEDNIEQIKKEKLRTEEKIENLRSNMYNEQDEYEIKKKKIEIRALKIIAPALDARIEIWEKFHIAQKTLESKLEVNGKKLDLLFFTLQMNAKIYRSASEVSQLRKTAVSALRVLNDAVNLQSVIKDLEKSWTDVNLVVEVIKNTEFVIE